MGNSVVEKKDKWLIGIIMVLGVFGLYFIDNSANIAILFCFIYSFNKYLSSREKFKMYEKYTFRDRDKFDRGLKAFKVVVNVYGVIRLIILLNTSQYFFIYSELFLIVFLYIPYVGYLNRKYVKNLAVSNKDRKQPFIRHRVIVGVVCLIFCGFTYYSFSSIDKLNTSDFIEYGPYKYELSESNRLRKVEVKMGSTYTLGEEREDNTGHFDVYANESKEIVKIYVLRAYLFIAMIVMLVLCFIETYPKSKKESSAIVYLFLVLFLVLSIYVFNSDVGSKETELMMYFHNYIS